MKPENLPYFGNRYAKALENSYSGYFFFLIGINMLILMFTGIQVISRKILLNEKLSSDERCLFFIKFVFFY